MSVSASARATASSSVGVVTAERPLVRVPAAAHEVGDGDALRRHRLLRQQPEHGGHLARSHPPQVLPVELDVPLDGPQDPAEPAQQRRLAAAVGAHDHRDLAGRHHEVDAVHHAALVVGEVHPVRGERHRLVPSRSSLLARHS